MSIPELPSPEPVLDPQPRQIPYLSMLLTVLLLLLFAVFFLTAEGWLGTSSDDAALKEGEQKLRELQNQDAQELTTYGKTNQAGRYRIPIDRAIERMVEDARSKGHLSYPLPQAKEPPSQPQE